MLTVTPAPPGRLSTKIQPQENLKTKRFCWVRADAVSCEASVTAAFLGRTPAEQLQQPAMAPHERLWLGARGGGGGGGGGVMVEEVNCLESGE